MGLSAFPQLVSVFRRHKEIALAYLFGSAAKRRRRRVGDIDIAVLLARPLAPVRKFHYVVGLSNELERLLRNDPLFQSRRADVILLNDADPLLAHQVVKYGRLLFERKKKMDRDFKVQAMTRYFDARPLHEFFFKRVLHA